MFLFLFGPVCAKKMSTKDIKYCFFVLSNRRRWAFLMVDVQFYKTYGFHSDLAEEHRRCIRPGFICTVLFFQVAGQIQYLTAHE